MKVRITNSTKSSSVEAEMNEYGLIFYPNGIISSIVIESNHSKTIETVIKEEKAPEKTPVIEPKEEITELAPIKQVTNLNKQKKKSK